MQFANTRFAHQLIHIVSKMDVQKFYQALHKVFKQLRCIRFSKKIAFFWFSKNLARIQYIVSIFVIFKPISENEIAHNYQSVVGIPFWSRLSARARRKRPIGCLSSSFLNFHKNNSNIFIGMSFGGRFLKPTLQILCKNTENLHKLWD